MNNNQGNTQWPGQPNPSASSAPHSGASQGGGQQWQGQPNYGHSQGQPGAPQQHSQYPATHPPQGQQFQPQGQQFAGGPAYQGSYGNYGGAPKKKTGLIVGLVIGVILIIATVVLVIVLTGGGDDKNGGDNGGGGGDVTAKEEKIREIVEEQIQASGLDVDDEVLDEAIDCTVQVFSENLTDEQIDDIANGDYSSISPEEQERLATEMYQCMPTEITYH